MTADASGALGRGPGAPALGIVLSGGRGSRLGGADKGAIEVGGSTLLDRAVAAAADERPARVVVVGPSAPSAGGVAALGGGDAEWRTTVESPRFGGPAVALAAGVRELLAWAGSGADALAADRDAWVTVLACDLPNPAAAVAVLDEHGAGVDDDGVVLQDDDGRAQWLTARYRLPALVEAVADVRPDDSLRALVGGLDLALVAAGDAVHDIDTPEDARLAGATVPGAGASGTMPVTAHDDLEGEPMAAPDEELDRWVARLAPELGLAPDEVPVDLLLDVARDVAHGVVRPGAPVSAFMLGLAFGQGRVADVRAGARTITDLAGTWADDAEAARSSLEDAPEGPAAD